jgi:hypothetical protein
MRIPTGGADHDSSAESKHGADVFNRCFRGGEVDDDIDACEIGSGERRGVLVLVNVERADAVAALARDFSDEAAGFPLPSTRMSIS